jgi:hypothetical protein
MKQSRLFQTIPSFVRLLAGSALGGSLLTLTGCAVSSDPAANTPAVQVPATVTGAPAAPVSEDVAATIRVVDSRRATSIAADGGATYRAGAGSTYLVVSVASANGAKGRPLSIAPSAFSVEIAGGVAYRAESSVPSMSFCASDMILVSGGKHTCSLFFEVPVAATPVRVHYYEPGLSAAEGAPRSAVAAIGGGSAAPTGASEVCGLPATNTSESCSECLNTKCCGAFEACADDTECSEAYAEAAACTTASCSQAVYASLSPTARGYLQAAGSCASSMCRSACEAQ